MAATLKQSLRLSADEDRALRVLYRSFAVTTDNLLRLPAVGRDLVSQFNALTGRDDSIEDVVHYMFTRRKKKQWEKLGRVQSPEEAYEAVKLDAEHWPHIDAIYEELQIASDNFAFDDELATKFAKEFAKRTGKIIPPMVLAAAVIARRKSAGLKTLKPKRDDDDLGFADIDQVAG
jgi:hypothetical protein